MIRYLPVFLCVRAALAELPLPAAAKKGVVAKGLDELRNLVILARNVARYSSSLGVSCHRTFESAGALPGVCMTTSVCKGIVSGGDREFAKFRSIASF